MSVQCPVCLGSKKVRGIFPVYAADVPDSERKPLIEIDCPECGGEGEFTEMEFCRRREWRERGEALKADRMKRGKGLRQEAQRRNMKPSDLSSMENGRVEPTHQPLSEVELRDLVDELQATIERYEAAHQERLAEVDKLQTAIRKHRDYRGDDRCFLDDRELYAVLPEGYIPPAEDTCVMLEYCKRFITNRQDPNTTYVSPERKIEELKVKLAAAIDERDWARCWATACDPKAVSKYFGRDSDFLIDGFRQWLDQRAKAEQAKLGPKPTGVALEAKIEQLTQALGKAKSRIVNLESQSVELRGMKCFSCGALRTEANAGENCDQAHREHWGHEWVSQRVLDLTDGIVKANQAREKMERKYSAIVEEYKKHQSDSADTIHHLRELVRGQGGDYWGWMGDGEDHLESLTCPVLIRPHHLREFIESAEAGKKFKAYVHGRLDFAGVPTFVEESKDGSCRIGKRLDWLFKSRNAARYAGMYFAVDKILSGAEYSKAEGGRITLRIGKSTISIKAHGPEHHAEIVAALAPKPVDNAAMIERLRELKDQAVANGLYAIACCYRDAVALLEGGRPVASAENLFAMFGIERRAPAPASSPLNHDHDLARAVHRVIRATHDGECPKCHKLTDSPDMVETAFIGNSLEVTRVGHCCPHCRFRISVEESTAGLALFAKFMDENLAVFEKWRAGLAAPSAEPQPMTHLQVVTSERDKFKAAAEKLQERSNLVSGEADCLGHALARMESVGLPPALSTGHELYVVAKRIHELIAHRAEACGPG